MAPKVLVVLTSYGRIESMDRATGWYLPELAHPYDVLKDKVEFTFASPQGGEAPLDPASVAMFKDPISVAFHTEKSSLWKNTHKLSTFVGRSSEFDAIFYPGGHGPVFDLATDKDSIALIAEFYNAGKIVSAVCHAPAVLVNVKDAKGEYIYNGKEVTGFTNSEEDAAGYTAHMPFLLETELKKNGATFVRADDWAPKVAVAGNLITGQNPASAGPLGEAIAKALNV